MSIRLFRELRAIAAALTVAILPIAAGAHPIPSYARAVQQIRGTISRFNGPTTMYVHDVRGYLDTVTLHKGTIINPTGIRLEPGFSVTIIGRPSGSVFLADVIDTPYHHVGYGPSAYPYWAPYPYPPVYLGIRAGWGWGWGWRH